MHSIVTPISHLFGIENNAARIARMSDSLECRDHSVAYDVSLQTLFHCELQPCHKLAETDFTYLEKIRDTKTELELISFHLASCYHSPVIENSVFEPGGYRYSKSELFENARINFKKIKKIFGPNVVIAIENNNFYATPAYEYVTDPEFISQVVVENNINFLYDIAHAKVSSYNLGLKYEAYKLALPLEKTVQLHICKSGIRNGAAYDAHFIPDEEEWTEIISLMKAYKGIRYFTIEYYREIDGLIGSIHNLKKIIT
jgi:uncharacterized protein (UPF0276 family)